MVEERAKAGARALSEWLRKCRVAVGGVRREPFVKLMEVLVGSVRKILMNVAWRVARGGWKEACTDATQVRNGKESDGAGM